MKLRLALLVALAALAPTAARALDPGRAPTQYVHSSWQTSDGLPQNTVTAIAQTRDGYLWLGTRGGLARFDGVRFTVFDQETTPELTQSQILSLLADDAGRLWIGTWGGGLVRLEQGRFTRFTTRQGLPSELVTALAQDARGRLWVGTDGGGVARMEGERFVAERPREALGAQVRALAAAPDGMWIGSDGGLAHLSDTGALTSLGPEQGLTRRSVRALLRDRRGTLWVGTDQGLNAWRDGRFHAVTRADGLPHDVVVSLAEDRDGSLWIGTDGGGAARLRDGRVAVYASANGLTNDSVLALHEDREGNLWLGTNLGGLNQLRDGRVAPFGRPEGLSHEYARAVFEDRAGALWFGTEGGGLVRLKDGRLTTLSSKEGLSNDTVFSIVESRAGDLWVGTDDGLNRIRDGRVVETFHAADGHDRGARYAAGFSNDSVLALLEDRSGTLWIGTYAGGLDRYRDGRFTAFTTREGLAHDTVNVLLEDHAGALWIGTRGGGLDRYADGRFEHFTTREGLSDDLVFALHEDASGALWIGTYGGGLNRYKDGRFTAVTRRHGLHDDVIHRVLEDGDGHVWLSGNRGIFRVDKSELDAVADGRRARLDSLVLGPADGMRDTECNGGASAGARTRDGHLWFPTVAGMVEIDPVRLRSASPPPPVVVESVLVDGRPVPADAPIEMPRGAQTLSLQFTGLSFVVPESIRFRYRLEGHEEGWVDAGTRRTTSYSKLPPGSYRFLVSASGADGVWSPEAVVGVSVQPFVHQTLWFRALLVALAALVPLGIHRLRTRRLRAREVELMALVADRTAELEQQRRRAEDANRAKSTFLAHASHELRTPLTSIIGFAQFLRRDESLSEEQRDHVGIIDRAGQHLLGLINDVLSLSQIEAGEEVLSPTTFDPAAMLRQVMEMLRARAEGKGLGLELDAAALPPQVRGDEGKLRQVLLNLAGNAVKFTARGGVTLRASWAAGRAVFLVEDTGPGMSAEDVGRLFKAFSQTETGRASREGTGLGLVISQGYARLMGGEVTVESRLGAGTTFRVEVDLPAASAAAAPQPAIAPVTGIENGNGRVRVLVVDDTAETRRMLASLLSGVGIEVDQAADGEQALARVRAFAPHAVCMDLRMPVLDGVGAIRRLRAEEQAEGRARTKVLAMSASAFAEERDEVVAAGADDFLAKPFHEEELFGRLGRLLGLEWRRRSS